jgi:hypothetical protein
VDSADDVNGDCRKGIERWKTLGGDVDDSDGGDNNVCGGAAGRALRRDGCRPRAAGRAGRGGGGGDARVSSRGASTSPPPPPDPRISERSIASRELRADVDNADIVAIRPAFWLTPTTKRRCCVARVRGRCRSIHSYPRIKNSNSRHAAR